jgi:hypothetical protein
MAKKLKPAQDKGVPNTGFTAPFSLESFRQDIVEVFVYYVRLGSWVNDWINEKTTWGPISISTWGSLSITDEGRKYIGSASEMGFTYERIGGTLFARYLENLYNFAYFGNADADCGGMPNDEDGGDTTWLTALVFDAAHSAMSNEFDRNGFGFSVIESAQRCLRVAETAQARLTLEGRETFYWFQGDENYGERFLTIRQMSLLAGMEEMSIRAAANPKRPNPIKTQKTKEGTRIDIRDAKEWLQSTGRYVPITQYWSKGAIDLTKRQFLDLFDLDDTLRRQFEMIKDKGHADLEDQLKQVGVTSEWDIAQSILKLDPNDPAQSSTLETIAGLLDLPPRLLYLRAKEVEAKQTLRSVELALRDLAQTS